MLYILTFRIYHLDTLLSPINNHYVALSYTTIYDCSLSIWFLRRIELMIILKNNPGRSSLINR